MTYACSAQNGGSKTGADSVVWEPPIIGWPDTLPRPTVPKEMIGSLRVGRFPVILEATKLEDAQRHFGGTIGRRGDGGESEAWLCLHGKDAIGPWVLWLDSGEIDGPAIGGFQWRRLVPDQRPDRRCQLIRKGGGTVELPLAVHLGMTDVEVRKALGHPTLEQNRTFFFFHEHQETIDKLPYTSDNSVAIVIRNGSVSAIEVSKTTSN